jgi:hypothetical protein
MNGWNTGKKQNAELKKIIHKIVSLEPTKI